MTCRYPWEHWKDTQAPAKEVLLVGEQERTANSLGILGALNRGVDVRVENTESMLPLAAKYGRLFYLEHALEQAPSRIRQSGRPLLYFALHSQCPRRGNDKIWNEDNVMLLDERVVTWLLEHNADLNETMSPKLIRHLSSSSSGCARGAGVTGQRMLEISMITEREPLGCSDSSSSMERIR